MSLKRTCWAKEVRQKKTHTLMIPFVWNSRIYKTNLSHQNKNIRCWDGVEGLTGTATRELSKVIKMFCVLIGMMVMLDLHIYQKSSNCTLKALTIHCRQILPQLFTKVLQSCCAFRGHRRYSTLTLRVCVRAKKLLFFGNSHINRVMYIIGFMWGKELI